MKRYYCKKTLNMIDLNSYSSEDIEIGLKLLNDPSLIHSKKYSIWLNNHQNWILYDELRMCKESGLLLSPLQQPDIDKQWKKINFNHTKKLEIYRILGVASIVVLIGIIGYFFSPSNDINLYNSNELTQITTLTLIDDTGEIIDLKTKEIVTNNEFSKINNTSYQGLRYTKDTSSKVDTIKYHTIYIPDHEKFLLILSDGSQIFLNGNTEFKYPIVFTDKERYVELKGEAYFDIKSDSTRPFKVKTKHFTTKVLGTEFNIRSYTDDTSSVTLVKGAVLVTANQNKQQVILQPSENASFTNEKFMVKSVNVATYTAWKDGYLYFDNCSLSEIIARLAHKYNLSIKYNNHSSGTIRLNFWANDKEDLEEIIERLSVVTNGRVSLTQDHIIIN